MSVLAQLLPAEITLVPDRPVTVELLVRNTGTIVEAYDLEVVGPLSDACDVRPPTLSVYPGEEARAAVTVTVERRSRVAAGDSGLAVRVTPSQQPQDSVVPEIVAHVSAFEDVSAELTPRTTRGRGRGRTQVAVDNRGNTALLVRLEPLDRAGPVLVQARTPEREVLAGTAEFVDVDLRARERRWTGPPQTLPFAVAMSTIAGSAPLRLDGTFVSEARIAAWVPRALLAVAASVLALGVLWFLLLRPAVTTAAEEAVADLEEAVQAAGVEDAEQVEAEVAAAQQQAVAAQEAAGSAQQAADGAVQALSEAGIIVEPGLVARGEPTTARLPLLDVPGGGAGDEGEFAPAEGGTFGLTDALFQNPFGASGTLTLSVGDDVLYFLGLQNMRDLDQHWITPIQVTAGEPLTAVIDCTEAGSSPDGCQVGVTITGTTTTSVPVAGAAPAAGAG